MGTKEVELIAGGLQTPVTIENRELFVRLFIQFEF